MVWGTYNSLDKLSFLLNQWLWCNQNRFFSIGRWYLRLKRQCVLFSRLQGKRSVIHDRPTAPQAADDIEHIDTFVQPSDNLHGAAHFICYSGGNGAYHCILNICLSRAFWTKIMWIAYRAYFRAVDLYSTTKLTNIFSQNDAGQSGGLGGQSLENSLPGAAQATHFIHSLDACYLRSGGSPGRIQPKKKIENRSCNVL